MGRFDTVSPPAWILLEMNSALAVVLVCFTAIKVSHGSCKCGQRDRADVAPALDCLIGQDEDIRLNRPLK